MELALPFLNIAYNQTLGEDALVVMGRGLGARALFCRCVSSFCGLSSREAPMLVIVIGFSLTDISVAEARAQVIVDMIEANGTQRSHLPVILHAGASKSARKAIYEKGGVVFAVSPQVVLQDSQGGKEGDSQRNLDLRRVDGIMVWGAEEAKGSDKVHWLMRKFKESNPRGFVKAFSEDPETLADGFSSVEKFMADIKVKKLQVWPRFNQHVVEDLSSRTVCHEYTQAQTHLMLCIQRGIAECLDSCIKEIKETSRVDTDDITVEKILFSNFFNTLRSRLNQRGKSQRSESALNGISSLRKLLGHMTRHDCVSFYFFLDSLRPAQGGNCPWLQTPVGERLIKAAQQRIYSIEELPIEFASQTKKSSSSSNCGEGSANIVRVGVEVLTGPSEFYIDEIQSNQSAFGNASKKSAVKRFKLKLILEQNPKVKLLHHVVLDIKAQWDRVLDIARNGGHDKSSASDMLHMDAPGAVALVACKDEESCYRLRDSLNGAKDWLETKLYNSLIRKADDSKVAREAVLNAYGIPLFAPKERGGSGCPWYADEDVLGSFDPLVRQLLLAADLPALDISEVRKVRSLVFKEPAPAPGTGNSSGSCPFIASERRLLWKLLAYLRYRYGTGGVSTSISVETMARSNMTSTAAATITSTKFAKDHPAPIHHSKLKENESMPPRQPPQKVQRLNAIQGAFFNQDDKSLTLEILPRLTLVFFPISSTENVYPILADLRPNFVVLYDPNPSFLRDAEVYSRTIAPECYATYMLTYSSSSEEGLYMNRLKNEKMAFERLISEKSRLVQPATTTISSTMSSAITSGTNRIDAWGINTSEEGYGMPTALNSGISDAVALLGAGSTDSANLIRRQDADIESLRPRIIVDMRETRSSLPNMIDKSGISVSLVTISVGDYVLSPNVCVERKSISDLIGSLANGRMFTQVENMLRYYSTVILLIECDPRKPFLLVDQAPNATQVEERDVRSQLTLLIMTYPNLRLVWSRSPETTVALFREIKRGKPEPSADEAVSRGQQSGVDSDDGGESIDQATRYRDNRNHQAIDLLKKLPGITSDNAEKVIAEISSLAELAVTSTEKLESLLGKEKGKMLYAFLHAKRDVDAPVAKKGRAQT